MAITLRADKGVALTYDEADENWDFLDRTKHDKLNEAYAGVYNNPRITVDSTGQIIAVEAAGNLTPGTYGTTARVPVITVDANGVITGISDDNISVGAGSPALLTIQGDNGLTGTTSIQLNQLADATATISHADTSSQTSVDNSNGNVIQDITLDDYGHITAIGSTNLDTRYQPLGSYDNYQNWAVQNSSGTSQFTVGSTNGVRFAASGDSSVSFDAATNTVTITTAAGSGGAIYASESYVDTAISNLVDTAPGTLDTLNELAASLNDDADFAGTMTTALATKLNSNDFTTTANTWLATKSTTNVSEGTNLYYTTARWDTKMSSASTNDLAEGTDNSIGETTPGAGDGTNRLYYTDARVATYLSTNNYATTSDISTAVSDKLVTSSNLSDLTNVTTARTNLGLGSLATLSTVNSATITDNSVGAAELNVTGNGTTSQFLRSDGDGTFTWATPTDTNTTYTAGSGLSLSGTTFSNSAPDQTVTLTGSGATSISGTYPNFTISSTDTNTDTTYSAGSGLDLSGTTFSVEPDLRGEMNTMGWSTTEYYTSQATTHDWRLDGNLDMRLENDGDLHVDGDVIAYSATTSDPRLKDNIKKVEGALDMVNKLNGYTFTYRVDGRESAGVMSTEVKEVLPSAVRSTTLPLKSPNGEDDTTEYDVVQYDQLHAVMIEAIKELKAEIEELRGSK